MTGCFLLIDAILSGGELTHVRDSYVVGTDGTETLLGDV